MIDFVEHKVIGYLTLSKGGMPQDVRVSPDGKAAAYVDAFMININWENVLDLHRERASK
jgi:hypothetical protein